MRSRVVQSFFVAATLTVVGALAPSASADDIDNQKAYVENIADQLEDLENRIGQLDEEYGATLDRIDELDGEIAISQAKVDAQRVELAALQGQLTSIAVDKFTSGGSSGLTPLFSTAEAFTEDLQRGELSRVALDQGAGDTDEMASLVEDLDDATAVFEDQKSEQADLLSSLDDKREQGEALVEQYEADYAAAKAELGNLIIEEQERRAAQAIAEAQARERQRQQEAEAKAAQAAAKVAASARGGGAMPANSGSSNSSSGSSNSGSGSSNSSSSNSSNASPNAANTAGNTSSSSSGGSSNSPVAAAPAPVYDIPPVSSTAGIAVNAASGQLGVPYRFAAEAPGVAFDCSGLTKYAWGRAGVYLPHQSSAQYASTPHVPEESAQPGDLIFYYSPIGHVAIYIGGGAMIHAPNSGEVVKVSPVRWNKVVGVSRPG